MKNLATIKLSNATAGDPAQPHTMRIDEIRIGSRVRKDLGDVRELADSIKTVGLLHPVVVTTGGELIAGQRRLGAYTLLGWENVPVTRIDLAEFLNGEYHENTARKNLTPSECVALMQIMEPLEREAAIQRRGTRTDLGQPARMAGSPGDARDKIARSAGLGRTSLKLAAEVVQAAKDSPSEYGPLVEQMDRTRKVAGPHRRLKVLKLEKQIRESPPQIPSGRYSVVVADPPWPFEGDQLPYPEMTIEDIKALPVPEKVEENSILWLWTTNTHLRVSFEVLDAWGFTYKNLLTWAKDGPGKGSWLQGQTEHCLLAVRGKPALFPGQTTLLRGPRGPHSQKPESFFEMVERVCPAPPTGRLEMFSRKTRAGWDQHGTFELDEQGGVEVEEQLAA